MSSNSVTRKIESIHFNKDVTHDNFDSDNDDDDNDNDGDDGDSYYGELMWNEKRFLENCKNNDDVIKYVAIYYLSHQTLKYLHITENLLECNAVAYANTEGQSCNWRKEDCLSGHQLENVRLVETQYSDEELCLQNRKFKSYIIYLKDLIQLIAHVYLNGKSLKGVLSLLQRSLDKLQNRQSIKGKSEQSKEFDSSYRLKATLSNTLSSKPMLPKLTTCLDEQADQILMLTYALHYTLKYEEGRFNQTKLKYELEEKALKQKLDEQNKLLRNEEVINDQILHYYFDDIENLRRHFAYLSTVYEEKETTLSLEVENWRRKIAKLKERQKFYEDVLNHYDEEIYAVKNNIPITRLSSIQMKSSSSLYSPSTISSITSQQDFYSQFREL